MVNAVDNVRRNGTLGNLLHVATIVKRKVFRKRLSTSIRGNAKDGAGPTGR